MQKYTHTPAHARPHTPVAVCEAWGGALHSLLSSDWTLREQHRYVHFFIQYSGKTRVSHCFYFCLPSNFAWAENGWATCIVLVWVWVWVREAGLLQYRDILRGLGLNTVPMLTFVAVSWASVFQPCDLKSLQADLSCCAVWLHRKSCRLLVLHGTCLWSTALKATKCGFEENADKLLLKTKGTLISQSSSCYSVGGPHAADGSADGVLVDQGIGELLDDVVALDAQHIMSHRCSIGLRSGGINAFLIRDLCRPFTWAGPV